MRYGSFFLEEITPFESMLRRMDEVIVQKRTRYQELTLFRSQGFGKILVLDKDVQSSESDEYVYHDTLVHPAMLAHPSPRSACIVGGGEGATLREVLRHPSIERCTMVDIDGELMELAREWLPEWHRGAFSDPRARVIAADARGWLEANPERYDVILVDLTDPVGADSPARFLFTEEWYRLLSERLEPGGVVALQAGMILPTHHREHSVIHHTVAQVFRHVRSYRTYIPSYFLQFGFLLASQATDPASLEVSLYAQRCHERGLALRYLTPELIRAQYALPGDLQKALREEQMVSRDADPFWLDAEGRAQQGPVGPR
jgi:spermidine synthase